MTRLFHKGLGYSAVNTARSAVSAVIKTKNHKTVGAHPKIVRFMKGVFELRTPKPKYNHTWDVNDLLAYFRTSSDNINLSLKELTRKLCALLLISTAQRVQTLFTLRVSDIHFKENSCTLIISEKLKHTRSGYQQKPMCFSNYSDEKVCVVSCLKEYIDRTKDLRGQTDQLILCHQKPFGAASKDSIARWLTEVLSNANIQGFAPHSFRGAASSAMLINGKSIQDIMDSAGWSNAQTFKRFYNKPIMNKKQHSKTVNLKSTNTLLNYFSSV